MARLIEKLLILLAVLLMPLGMQPAAASVPATHPMAMPMEHCPGQAPSHSGKAGFVECTMACAAALPAIDTPPDEPPLVTSLPVEPSVVHSLHGLHPDTATPPPKRS